MFDQIVLAQLLIMSTFINSESNLLVGDSESQLLFLKFVRELHELRCVFHKKKNHDIDIVSPGNC